VTQLLQLAPYPCRLFPLEKEPGTRLDSNRRLLAFVRGLLGEGGRETERGVKNGEEGGGR